ncbi:TonB-dependent receptor [Terriglobus roseus]|uniref:Carboxypeptidase regulatory-like domain-containing protein n=1 Tax=Terriglobus roseus TaxID=392734 RepID=A0A1H4L0K1_9BACT|nr:carboxypeptidase-like regulatory domain-containing protein [Terriglobus roseus]SEB64251.1 Carboxypeptidase regulatory-like domain-containing protein [Terriglobus roseus]
MMHKFLRPTIAVLMTGAAMAHAQGGSAVLSGVVNDSTGAAVPDSQITLVNTETNLTMTAKSNDSGLYQFPTVPPGNYIVTVSHEGFQKFQQKGIQLTVSQQATLPIALIVGSQDEVVDVTADTPLLNATNAEVSNTVGEQAVRELPLNGRDPSSLVLLSPGIVNILNTSAGTQQNQTTFPNESGASAGGGRQGSTLYLLDGVPNMDTYMLLAAPSPNSDATGQFRVISNNFDAHYGFSPGAVVSIETKSGTNSFHGGVFEFIRNSALNSANYFSHAVDPLKRNQFGGFLGGPILKDRAFFFANYQQTRQSSASTGNSVNLPTAAMLNGDFSSYSGTLRAPFTTVNGKKNQINPNQYDSAALAIARTVFPLGTDPATGLYYYTTPKTVEVFHEATGRIDYNLSQNQRLALRSFIQYYNRPQALQPGNALAAVTAKSGKLFNEVLNHTWTISPTAVNELSLFWNQMNVSTSAPTLTSSGSQFCLSQVANISDPAGTCYLGTFSVTGAFSASNSGFTGERRNSFGFNEGFTKTLGNHTLTAGADLWHQWARELTSYPANAIPTFSGYYTGLGLADYLLGKVGTYLQGAGELAEVQGNLFGAFAQDQYRATPKLTITAGLRWDPNFMPNAKGGRGVVYSPGQQSTMFPGAPRGLVFPGDSGVPQSLVKATYGYFEPRMAIAYQWTPKTAIRAGFGVFSAPLPYSLYNHTVDVSPFSPTYTLQATLTTPDIQLSNPWKNYAATNFTSPFPPFVYGGAAPASNFNFGSQTSVSAAFSPGFKLGMTQSWNASVEQQFGKDFAAHLAYVGSQSYHQTTGIDRNPGQIATAALRGVRPNTAIGQLVDIESFGTASYHSLQLQLEKRMSHGLQFQSSFTWSKNIDIISSGNVTFAKAYLPNPYNVRYNRGISSLNIPLNSVTNVVYTTPSLKGHNAFLRGALGDWEGSIIYTMRSGLPFGINGGNGNNNSGSLQNQDRADRNVNVNLQTHQGGKSQWLQQYFTTTAFAQNAAGTFGTSGRNLLQGPGLNYGDLALMKNWTAMDHYHLQFRWEMFNAFNHTSFATPDNTVGSSTYGRITAIGPVAPRIQQAGLKLTF